MENGESQIEQPHRTERIYSIIAIQMGTFLGGPLTGAYMIAHNFRVFGEPQWIKHTWLICALVTILIIILLNRFEGYFDTHPGTGIFVPLFISLVANSIAMATQGRKIAGYLLSGGEKFSGWRTLGIGIIGTVVSLVLIILGALIYTAIVPGSKP